MKPPNKKEEIKKLAPPESVFIVFSRDPTFNTRKQGLTFTDMASASIWVSCMNRTHAIHGIFHTDTEIVEYTIKSREKMK